MRVNVYVLFSFLQEASVGERRVRPTVQCTEKLGWNSQSACLLLRSVAPGSSPAAQLRGSGQLLSTSANTGGHITLARKWL